MKQPEMILFDYGHTLLYEPDFDFLRGERTLFEYITQNPNRLSPEQVNAFKNRLFEEFGAARALGVELHERQFQRLVNEYLGLAYSIGDAEAELIQWNAVSPGAMMPDADKIVDYVNQKGIRSGVISNIGWSGNALQNRIGRLLPRNQFEFVIASSEYGLRKPSPYLFGLALRKAGLPPDCVWFCGDNPQKDIEGAARIGIFPVWYDNDTGREHTDRSRQTPPACEHLHIREWDELIQILDAAAP